MEPQIKFVRLNTGEDIITELGEETSPETITLRKPLKIFYSMMENDNGAGAMGVSLIHWIFPKLCKVEEVTIANRDVLLVSEASPEMTEYYHATIESIKQNSVYQQYLEDEYKEYEDYDIELSEEDEESVRDFLDSIQSNQKRTLH